MRVFVAGATGALGRRLVPKLVENGHQVTGTTRSESKADMVRALGGEPAVLDALDKNAVKRAVEAASRGGSPPCSTRWTRTGSSAPSRRRAPTSSSMS